MMKLVLTMLFSLFPVLSHHSFAENIKHLTVDDYLQQAKAQEKKANKLIDASSPYLLQHAYNPVEWYPWGVEAFEKARRENKPIFLSIGYSTCHWCHVMAHESFENIKIAELLNKYFVCVKVDREQRPDIDSIYMTATELINGHSGWPMTVFLDHQLRPFHAATYYPPFTGEKGLGLEDVLLRLHEIWLKQPEKISEVAAAVTARMIESADETSESGRLAKDIVEQAMRQIAEDFDTAYGGFSDAPKFPSPGIFSFLNQVAASTENTGLKKVGERAGLNDTKRAKEMMRVTLDAMAAGGVYDHLAGGFHRYSVDAAWQVPHFEKMLYSQALMAMAFIEFYQVEPQEKYKKIIYQTLHFAVTELRSAAGGFYSALDADSATADRRGQYAEGAYYLWRSSEIKETLTADEFLFIKKYFHIEDEGNIAIDPYDAFQKLNILYVDEDYRNSPLTQQQLEWLFSAENKLNARRHLRPRPHLDDKTIAAWNGMMMAVLAKASAVFNDQSFLQDAIETADYIKAYLYRDNGNKLLRQYRESTGSTGNSDKPGIEATLEDYVWVIYGLLEVYKVNKDKQWLDWAIKLHDKQDELFLDDATGAYFEWSAHDASLLFRSKSIFDGALPSSNAIALSNLRQLSLSAKTSSQRKALSVRADKLVSSFSSVINQYPAAAAALLAVDLKHIKAEQ